MREENGRDVSITLTSFFMKCAGFWLADDAAEQRRRNIALFYTVNAILFAVWVETRDFYYTWGNFSDSTYIACNIMCLVMVLFKIFVLFMHRSKFINLILYAQKNFWHSDYDPYETRVLNECKRRCTFFVCFFTFFAQGTIMGYVVTPILENVGKNESDRVLPFNMWLDLPLWMSPYFEILFVTQIMSLYPVGICYFCFDNFLCILNVHTAGQFRILQYRLSKFCSDINGCTGGRNDSGVQLCSRTDKCYGALKNCIRQHQALINYCEQLENVFTLIVLGQVVVFSVLICLVGYQILLADSPPARRTLFIFHITGCMCQLMMFTYSCGGLIEQSGNVGTATYSSTWTSLAPSRAGRSAWRDLAMIITRSRRPCCLTASGFFPVSLETYTAVLSTALSYFTLLRQRFTDVAEKMED